MRTWAPAEAQAMAFAAWLASASTSGASGKLPVELRQLPGYAIRVATRDGAGAWQLAAGGAEAAGAAAFGGGGRVEALLYLVPDGSDDGARRILCLRSDGAMAFSDNAEGTGSRDGRELVADDALAGGGKGTLRDFPRAPTIGGDRNLWLPADHAPRASVRVIAVDEDGNALGGLGVATVAAGPEHAVDAPLPAAFARTLLEGDAMLHGVPARGLGFTVTLDTATVTLPSVAVRLDGATARLTVPKQAMQQVRRQANEWAAIATLKNISSAQAQCQASGVIDANGNGAGEYGTFAELAGRDVVRGGTAKMSPPVLSTAFGRVENGIVQRSGYCFRIFLPGKDGVPVAERVNGGPEAAAIDSKQAEVRWCVYAWPIEAGGSGQRAFWIDQGGDVLASPNADGRYSGPAKAPLPDAARKADSDGTMQAPAAANQQARDGQTWVVIG